MRSSIGIGLGIGLTKTNREWSPRMIGNGLQLWVRADLGVTINSGRVTSWADQSGKNRNFGQGSFSKQPVIDPTYMGGKPAVFFDGTTRIVNSNWSLNSITSSADVFIVAKVVSDPSSSLTGNGGFVQLCSPEGDEQRLPYLNGQTRIGMFSLTNYTVGSFGSNYYTQPRIVSVYGSTADWRFMIDGVDKFYSPTNTFYSGAGGLTSTSIGGDAERTDCRMYGGVSEVIVASPAMTSNQRASTLRYLKQRYSIT